MNTLGIAFGIVILAGGIYFINKKTGIFSEMAEDIDKAVTRMHESFWEGYQDAGGEVPAT